MYKFQGPSFSRDITDFPKCNEAEIVVMVDLSKQFLKLSYFFKNNQISVRKISFLNNDFYSCLTEQENIRRILFAMLTFVFAFAVFERK